MKKNEQRRKEKSKMAALATPKKSSYIVKKSCAEQIINSKVSKSKKDAIQNNATLFCKNNLKIEK